MYYYLVDVELTEKGENRPAGIPAGVNYVCNIMPTGRKFLVMTDTPLHNHTQLSAYGLNKAKDAIGLSGKEIAPWSLTK